MANAILVVNSGSFKELPCDEILQFGQIVPQLQTQYFSPPSFITEISINGERKISLAKLSSDGRNAPDFSAGTALMIGGHTKEDAAQAKQWVEDYANARANFQIQEPAKTGGWKVQKSNDALFASSETLEKSSGKSNADNMDCPFGLLLFSAVFGFVIVRFLLKNWRKQSKD